MAKEKKSRYVQCPNCGEYLERSTHPKDLNRDFPLNAKGFHICKKPQEPEKPSE